MEKYKILKINVPDKFKVFLKNVIQWLERGSDIDNIESWLNHKDLKISENGDI